MALPSPTDARLLGEELLEISWSDDRRLHYPIDRLRAACPCAHCSNSDQPPPEPASFPGIRLQSLDQVGNYAFRIAFSDGHDIGIYTWPRLLQIGHEPGQVPAAPPAPPAFEV